MNQLFRHILAGKHNNNHPIFHRHIQLFYLHLSILFNFFYKIKLKKICSNEIYINNLNKQYFIHHRFFIEIIIDLTFPCIIA